MLENPALNQLQTQSFEDNFSDFRGAVRKDTVNLKLDIIKQTGQGYSTAEIVQSLSEKYHVSTRDVYYHISTMSKWTQYFLTVQESKQTYLTTLIKLDWIYRELSFVYQHAKDDNARIGALKGMLFTIKEKAELTNIAVQQSPDEIKLSWQRDSFEAQELLKRYDEIINISRSMNGEVKHIIEIVDPDNFTPEEKQTVLNAEEIISKYEQLKAEGKLPLKENVKSE